MRSWIKLHTLKLDDVRLLRLSERTQLRYLQLYMLAGRLDENGCFIENGQKLNERDIALKLRIRDVRLFKSDLKALKDARLISVNGHGPFIADFKNEQVDWDRKRELDRERQKRKRENDVTRDTNVTDTPSRASHAPRPDQDQTKNQIKTKKRTKPTTHTPPSKQDGSNLAGGLAGEKDNFNKSERKIADAIQPIWQSAGLGQAKIKNLVNKMAIRSSPDNAIRSSLAALASAYADNRVNNKVIVAVHRLENNSIPAEYFDPKRWKDLPKSILNSAGIDDLNQYTSENDSQSAAYRLLAARKRRAQEED